MLVVVILTKNEQIHIRRCLQAAKKVSKNIIVIDSGSTDQTKSICDEFGVFFIDREWKNYSNQFNFGLQKAREMGARFVLRLDADEYFDDELVSSIKAIDFKHDKISGYYLQRHITFLGKFIRFGGATPISVIRLFRVDKGQCEERWMDEHIVVSGVTKKLRGKLIDDSRKDMNWWINKHLWYAERESIDILTSSHRSGSELNAGSNKVKRIIKAVVYNQLPLGVRPALYFCYQERKGTKL